MSAPPIPTSENIEGNTVSDNCTHQNLGSVQINIVNGKTTVSADCLDCGAQIRR